MIFKLVKRLFLLIVLILGIVVFVLYRKIYVTKFNFTSEVSFAIEQGESVASIAKRLEEMNIVSSASILQKYVAWKKFDRSITHGTIIFDKALTIVGVAELLSEEKPGAESVVTIIPGSNLRDIAESFEKQGIATSAEVYALLGTPVKLQKPELNIDVNRFLFHGKPENVSLEGYLAPETFNVFAQATLLEVVNKFINEREDQIEKFRSDIEKSGQSVFEILTLASVLDREVRSLEDRKIVADIFWRRLRAGWALQADSTVHYIVGTSNSVFTTAKDRDTDSPWNTYKYPGLPAGPISAPSVSSIEAVLNPTPNDYWYFLTTLDTGEAKYGRTLDEHNLNVAKYLR
ncbi:MAG: endolytic transglycosylase MltG [Candidatus Magasanikbacteria bacterium]|nr:endolytic transglycosylase MltG [Candidatus Magasanikbacteria bacterium]